MKLKKKGKQGLSLLLALVLCLGMIPQTAYATTDSSEGTSITVSEDGEISLSSLLDGEEIELADNDGSTISIVFDSGADEDESDTLEDEEIVIDETYADSTGEEEESSSFVVSFDEETVSEETGAEETDAEETGNEGEEVVVIYPTEEEDQEAGILPSTLTETVDAQVEEATTNVVVDEVENTILAYDADEDEYSNSLLLGSSVSSYYLTYSTSSTYGNFYVLGNGTHGKLYPLKLYSVGSSSSTGNIVFCLDFGKNSPTQSIYTERDLDDYYSSAQQLVLKQGLLFVLYYLNCVDGSLTWGTSASNLSDIGWSSKYYLYMQTFTWAASKGYSFLECASAVQTVANSQISTSEGTKIYNAAKTFYNNRYDLYYSIDVSCYWNGNSTSQKVYSYSLSSCENRSKGIVQITKQNSSGSSLSGATFTLYQYNSSSGSYVKAGTLSYSSSTKLYTSSVALTYNASNQGLWKIVETAAPSGYYLTEEVYYIDLLSLMIDQAFYYFAGANATTNEIKTYKNYFLSGELTEYEIYYKLSTLQRATNRSNTQYVEALYRVIFNRASDSTGLDNWVTQLDNGDITRAELLATFWAESENQRIIDPDNSSYSSYGRITAATTITNYKAASIKISKSSSDSSITLGNSSYSLTGAVYTIYTSSSCSSSSKVGTITLGTESAKGVATGTYSGLDPTLTYYVKETTAPTGYAIDSTVYKVTVTANATTTLTLTDDPISSKGRLLLTKTDSATGDAITSGPTFVLYEWDGSSYVYAKKLTYSSSLGAWTSGNVLYYNSTNQGKWKLVETSPGTGYVDSGNSWTFNFVEELISSAYQKALGRAAKTGDPVSTWVNYLVNGTKTEADLYYMILCSDEFIEKRGSSDSTFIYYCYLVIFNRDSSFTITDTDGGSYVTALSAGTMTRKEVIYELYSTTESASKGIGGYRVELTKSWTNTPQGKIKVTKSSSDPTFMKANSDICSIVGAKYGVYSNSSCTTLVTTITIGSSGTGTSGYLDPGTYYVKEIANSDGTGSLGHGVDTTVYTATVGKKGATVSISSTNPVLTKRILVQKYTDEAGQLLIDTYDTYTLAGAVYGVYSDSACTTEVSTITTDENGEGYSGYLPTGTYYVKETTAPSGFELSSTVYTVVLKSSDGLTEYPISCYEEAIAGSLEIHKDPEHPAAIAEDDSFAGAIYGVYAESSCKTLLWTMETEDRYSEEGEAYGYALLENVPVGTYYIKELVAPNDKYGLDETVYQAVVDSSTAVTIYSKEPTPTLAYIRKANANVEFTNVIPYYTLLNATFGIYTTYAEAKAATADNPGNGILLTTTFAVEDPDNPATTAYEALTETVELDSGIYYVKELTAPENFRINEDVYEFEVTAGITNEFVISDIPQNLYTLPLNDLAIEIYKVDGDSQPIEGAVFLVEMWDEDAKEWIHPYEGRESYSDLSNQLSTDENGYVEFPSLMTGTYRVTELATDSHHVLLTDPFEIELPVVTTTGTSSQTPTYSQDGSDYFFTYTVYVKNGTALEMPMTGGEGNLLAVTLGIAGLTLFALGEVLFVRRRKDKTKA